jgi:hypothetical protein
MSIKKTRFVKGVVLAPDNLALESLEGELKVGASDGKLKATLGGAAREVLTDSQTQTLTNKSIDADNNPISNLEVDNLKAGVLNTSTSMAGASNTQVPSALAIKTYIDDKAAAQNEASEISFDPAGTISATNVQAMGEELDSDIQAHLNDTTDAHDASAISVVPSGNLTSTEAQAAFVELQLDINTRATSSDLSTHISDTTTHGTTGDIVGTSDAQVLTNKTINADLNTITNIDNADIKAGAAIDASKIANGTVSNAEFQRLDGVGSAVVGISDAQTLTNKIIDADLNIITNIENADIKSGAAIDASKIANGSVSNTEFQYLDGVTSAIQTQLNAKVNSSGGTLTNGSIVTPTRLDVKQDIRANLDTYATTATNGQIVFATDEKQMYQVVDNQLVSIGGQAIIKPIAGENLSVGNLVYISTGTGNDSGRTSGRAYKTDASNDDRVEVIGFVSKAASTGNAVEIQTSGLITGLSGLTAGQMYYASPSTPGAITSTPPSTGGQWIVAIGVAYNSTSLVLNPVASASAIYIQDDFSFTIANNQSSAANITNLLFDGVQIRGFSIEYTVYRQTDTASSAVAQIGNLRGVYNTQSATWFMSDDYSGQNSGVSFSILSSGQLRYTSSNIAGANYVGVMKYSIKRTLRV